MIYAAELDVDFQKLGINALLKKILEPFLNSDLGKGAKEIPDGDELASFIQPENVSSHVNLFRSPFDPRSEDLLYSRDKDLEDLASSTGKHRHRQSEWSESGSGAKILFDEAKPIIESGQHSRSRKFQKSPLELSFFQMLPLTAILFWVLLWEYFG